MQLFSDYRLQLVTTRQRQTLQNLVVVFFNPERTVCHQFHVAHTGIQTIPFIDGKVSVSLIGRQVYSIGIFKPAFFLYAFIYYNISKYN